MTVSVIVPNYCHAPYLRQRIDSILAQTYPDFEMILLDDCSTDGSRDILESYRSNPKVSHIVFSEQNSGSPFIQWQRGFELARGRYIWIAESDDYADPHLLERCVECLEADPQCVLAHTDGYFTDSKGHPTTRTRPVRPTETFDGHRFAVERLLEVNTVYNASMAVFRRDALPDPRDYAHYRYNGDLLFWILVSLRGRVCSVHEQLNYFRQHTTNTTSVSARSGMMYVEMLSLLDKVLPMLPMRAGQRYSLIGKLFSRLKRDARRNGWGGNYPKVWQSWKDAYGHPSLHILWNKIYRILPIR